MKVCERLKKPCQVVLKKLEFASPRNHQKRCEIVPHCHKKNPPLKLETTHTPMTACEETTQDKPKIQLLDKSSLIKKKVRLTIASNE